MGVSSGDTTGRRPFIVLRLILDSGERLPCLVHSGNWHPARVATRWAVRYRRYHVQFSTLDSNLRSLGRLYTWALESLGIQLDDFLTSGGFLDNRQIESFAAELRSNLDGSAADTGAFDQNLSVIEDFLRWSLDNTNRGGGQPLTLAQLSAERQHLGEIFRSLRIGGRPPNRIQPLEEDEVRAIRRTIGPQGPLSGAWTFPAIFAPHARLRNWLMFEVALQLGIRRGELLKLRLDSLPRGAGDGVLILRRPDDPHDSRAHEPAVKTAERVIPASRDLLSAIRAYLTYPPPLGRVSGQSPYLFVARSGAPLSCDRADDVIVAIGRHSGVQPLSWHRLRHTWAETMALALADKPNGMDRLVYLGGWTNASSAGRYIQRAIAKQAQASLREYQRGLYQPPRQTEVRP
jgi:integrase